MFLRRGDELVYVVLYFDATRGGIALSGQRFAACEASAIRLAERLARFRAGAFAFVCGGTYGEPVELARFGSVPTRLPCLVSA